MPDTIGFYGKLPQFEDYIQSERFGVSFPQYQDWLDASFDSLHQNLGDRLRERLPQLPVLSLALRLPDASTGIVAVSQPSRDKSGRPSLFTILAAIPQPILDDHLALIPEAFRIFVLAAERSLQSSDDTFALANQPLTVNRLQDSLPRSEADADSEVARFLENTTINRLDGGFGGGTQERVQRVIRNLVGAVLPLRGQVPRNFRAVFRFPLTGKVDTRGREIAFWIRLTGHILGEPPAGKALFWTEQWFDVAFALVDRSLLATEFVIDNSRDQLWDFASMQLETDPAHAEVTQQLGSVLGAGEVSLATVCREVETLMSKVTTS